MIDLTPLGDRAWLARFVDEDSAHRWVEAVRARAVPGVVDLAVAYASAAVYADPDAVDLGVLETTLRQIVPVPGVRPTGRLIVVPVLYEGEDLAEVADRVGLSVLEVIDRHSSVAYRVFAIGFQPGFPYAGYLAEPLAGLARKSRPRTKVPAGSVAIAGRQTGIYPVESPGGWLLLGRTPLVIVDLNLGRFPIRPGDRIQFQTITRPEFQARLGEPLEPPVHQPF